ncbi:MAG: class I SAM-dependent methyltransferase [Acholeplasmataceae bacterium]
MYRQLANYYDIFFPLKKAEADFLANFIKKSKKALDLGTGTGNTAFHLESLGLKVTAVDLSEEMVQHARSKYPAVNFLVNDLIYYLKNTEEMYDVVTCFGNTLAHLTTNQLDTFFKLTSAHLKKKGILFIQLLNYDFILKNKPNELPKIKMKNLLLERLYHYIDNKILFETKVILDNNIVHQGETVLYPHLRETIKAILEKYNFKYEVFGQFDLSPWSINSTHLTIVAKHKIIKTD